MVKAGSIDLGSYSQVKDMDLPYFIRTRLFNWLSQHGCQVYVRKDLIDPDEPDDDGDVVVAVPRATNGELGPVLHYQLVLSAHLVWDDGERIDEIDFTSKPGYALLSIRYHLDEDEDDDDDEDDEDDEEDEDDDDDNDDD